MDDCISQLKDVKNLKYDWNGYGAKPFSEALINKCFRIAKALPAQPMIYPTGRNSMLDDPWYTGKERDIFGEIINGIPDPDSYPYKSCKYRNYCGNCLAVGGFCTSVGEKHCKLKSEFQRSEGY